MKKIIALLLSLSMLLALAACTSDESPASTEAPAADAAPAAPEADADSGSAASELKIGVVLIGEKSDNGYNYNHVIGFEKMQEELGIADEQIIYKQNVPESSECDTAIRELVEEGCDVIFANSFGHEQYMVEIASEYPDIEFCHATGYLSATDELDNTHNYFASIYEARYLAGIAAGLKAKEVGNPKLGYVGALAYAEVISGFTAFYLGAKSVYPEVTMDVIYTNVWSDATLEAQAAQALADRGCSVISQHSDTTAPATTAESSGIFHVGYNADMISAAPAASLVSARVDWGTYYTFATECMINGDELPQDWCEGLSGGAVYLSPLNEDIIAEGTADAISAAEQGIRDGSLHVFAGPLAGEGDNFGEAVSVDIPEGEWFPEQEESSAPSWCYIIDGINIISG